MHMLLFYRKPRKKPKTRAYWGKSKKHMLEYHGDKLWYKWVITGHQSVCQINLPQTLEKLALFLCSVSILLL